jgi:serine/threonine-protein kinase
MQSDIAQQVARALDVSLLSPEASALEQKLTSNAEAYDYFLQGNEYENRSPSKADGDIAIEQYERAIALDPNFAAAYARLSISHARAYWFYFDRTQERVAKARRAAEKALKLAPDLSVTHEAMGWLNYHTALKYDAAVREFNIALQLQPNNPTVSYGLAAVYRRKGDLDESLHHWRKAIASDPRSSELVRQLGETLSLLRRYEDAEEQYAVAIRLAPDNISTYGERAKNFMLWKGDIRAASKVVDEGLKYGRLDSGEDQSLPYMKFFIAWTVEDFAKASQALALMDQQQGQASQFVFYPRALLSAQLERARGDRSKARALFQQAADQLQRRLREHPEDERAHSSLGIAFAGLGRDKEAVQEGLKGVELLPVEKELWRGSYRLRDLAEVYAMTGEQDKAIDVLDRLLKMPSELSGAWITLDPRWKPLHGNKRFEALTKAHS